MPELPHRCSFHKYLASERGYRTGEWVTFPPCESMATHYVAVQVEAGDFAGEQYINLCTPHEVEVRATPGWKWSRPKDVAVRGGGVTDA